MQAGEFVHTFGDAHLYLNHVEQAELQLTRQPRPLPTLRLNPARTEIDSFDIADVELARLRPASGHQGADRGLTRPAGVRHGATLGRATPARDNANWAAPGIPGPPSGVLRELPAGELLEVHATHVRSTTGRRAGLLRLVGHDGLGGQEQRGDRRGVLQRRADHLGRVRHAGGQHVARTRRSRR